MNKDVSSLKISNIVICAILLLAFVIIASKMVVKAELITENNNNVAVKTSTIIDNKSYADFKSLN